MCEADGTTHDTQLSAWGHALRSGPGALEARDLRR